MSHCHEKIIYIILTYFLISTQILADVLCYTTILIHVITKQVKIDYSETEPSRWTLIIEFFDDKNIIVRPREVLKQGVNVVQV